GVHGSARPIPGQSARMAQIRRETLGCCRRRSSQAIPVDLVSVALGARSVLAPLAAARRVTVSLEPTKGTPSVRGNPDTLLIAVMHVLESSIQASPEGNVVSLRIRGEPPPADSDARCPLVCVEVDDEGARI